MRHTGMTNIDDSYYIRQVKEGNTNAFSHIVRRYQRMIFTIVRKIVMDPNDAEDITQEIFLKAFMSLEKFREESGFSTWLYRIAYNTAISEIRKRKLEFTAIEENLKNIPDSEISDSIDGISKEKQLEYLDAILKKLTPDNALLISLFYLNNHSMQEIGEITGLSLPNVKVKLHRIRKFMNFEMNKLISR